MSALRRRLLRLQYILRRIMVERQKTGVPPVLTVLSINMDSSKGYYHPY